MVLTLHRLAKKYSHGSPSSTTSITHRGTSLTSLTQSSSVGPWVFDSGATDHINGNKSLFFSLSSMDNLPSVTMTNKSQS